MALLLSQYLRVGAEDETPKSESHQRNQTISAVVVAVARYSASQKNVQQQFTFTFPGKYRIAKKNT